MATLPGPVFRVSSDSSEIEELVTSGGFCPIECSIGGKSIVDDLELDHHGEYSHLPGVALAAYKQYPGECVERPFLVTVPPVDADACFAAAALLGLLPHPKDGPGEKNDLTDLAETINKLDLDPIGINPLDLPGGELLLAWNVIMSGNNRSDSGFAAGTYLWQQLTTAMGWRLKPLLAGVEQAEIDRRTNAHADLKHCPQRTFGPVLCLYETEAWGFDVWYDRKPVAAPVEPHGWEHPVVLALGKQSEEITIGCPNDEVAEACFGPGGLKNVFAELQPEGWGGRESIGGSPRGQELGPEQLWAAGKVVASKVTWWSDRVE
jgi:hypothetical protein